MKSDFKIITLIFLSTSFPRNFYYLFLVNFSGNNLSIYTRNLSNYKELKEIIGFMAIHARCCDYIYLVYNDLVT